MSPSLFPAEGECSAGACAHVVIFLSGVQVKLATVLQTATSLLDRLLFLPNHFLQLVIKVRFHLVVLAYCRVERSHHLVSMGTCVL